MTQPADHLYNYIFAKIGQLRTKILVDTGASRSVISASLLNKIRPHVQMQNRPYSEPDYLVTASGTKLFIDGIANVTLNIQGYNVSHNFLVLRNLQHQCVMGVDMLQACRGIVNTRDRVLD